ncbi:hypothetical protein A2165_03020 [Candidatus Curtissbacteria bacterium RBG_13_40_7]|uniref:Uncharacterized protein n=1 Tax=Candidatus Curtissbacteria bacterium RBG_13_40_7 TaxID=1797706 RepID=A0A1F5FVJ4_9BACT|nr:MAG: hypothetical protein A2165_03020 [Candidatus Curtissbacteria bacterium RBG_13_40_7]
MKIDKLLGIKYIPSAIGLLQAIGVLAYCGLVAILFFYLSKTQDPPGFFGFFLMLMLFVFSAAVTGSLVFGYPAFLTLVKHKPKEALTILSYTLLFGLVIILLTIIAILLFV